MARRDRGGPLSAVGERAVGIHNLNGQEPAQRLWCGFEGFRIHETTYRQVVDEQVQFVAVYIIEGDGIYVDEGGSRTPFGKGDAFIRYPDVSHGVFYRAGATVQTCFLAIPQSLSELLSLSGVLPREHVFVIHPGTRDEIPTRVRAIIRDLNRLPAQSAGPTILAVHELLVDMYRWHALSAPVPPEDALVSELCRRLETDLAADRSLPEIAAELNSSYSTLRRLFRERVGVSPGEYRIRRRIDTAQRLLADPALAIKEVAYRLGYPNVQSFTRQFHRVTGSPPKRFRNHLRP